MGSFCALYFDELSVCGSKNVVPDEFCAIFQESDRVVRQSADFGESQIIYQGTQDAVLARLDLLGCTTSVAAERFETWLHAAQTTWNEYTQNGGDWAIETAKALRSLTLEEWRTRVPGCIPARFSNSEVVDEVDRHMRSADDSWLWFDGCGSLVGLRAILDACVDVNTVTLDVTGLIWGGWLDADLGICEVRRRESSLEPRPLAPTMVLAEGSSDIKILQRSLAALFPERCDYFSFLNHSEFSVDGGSTYLVKFIKAFASARAPFLMVAIFDNDTAGLQAFRQASALTLPDNILVMHLPDIDLARSYPTLGPQGSHPIDVNGKAASIELYLGRAALSLGGELRPVRWTGYNHAACAYQGEVESKANIESVFFKLLETYTNPYEARAAFPELGTVGARFFWRCNAPQNAWKDTSSSCTRAFLANSYGRFCCGQTYRLGNRIAPHPPFGHLLPARGEKALTISCGCSTPNAWTAC